ncbi:MAG: PDDEXK nuclease domain-containing protein [Bacteroidales bacterium]|nr:DUF1016 family protein [Bacteroidales bacterium]MCR4801361.1 PDDEXK nuclease domain-containing protein [Bacteroidales bacterium]
MNKELPNNIDISQKEIFEWLTQQIRLARKSVFEMANRTLVDLYWQIGKLISEKVKTEGWGKGIVSQLATYIATELPEAKGFSDKNLWRMKQFYELYNSNEKLSPMVRELSWTHNITIMSRCKSDEERLFYLQMCKNNGLTKRELERQIDTAQYERSLTSAKLSPMVRELLVPEVKDTYVLEFLGLPENHSESQLQKALVANMKQFILELGSDFIFMAEEFRLQVGCQDFYIDLLFFHRGIGAMVAFELKVGKFKPEFLGQLDFYLEALDRDVKKPHENPSIGILLCHDKDDEVVEYALSRSLSPTLVAQYQLQLPDKKVFVKKLKEILD